MHLKQIGGLLRLAQVEIRFTRPGNGVLSATRGIFGLKMLQTLETSGCSYVSDIPGPWGSEGLRRLQAENATIGLGQ